MSENRKRKIVIVMWYAYSRRAKSLSVELDAELILLDTFITKNIKLRKFLIWIDYLFKSLVTFKILHDRNPDIIIATSPPSFCPIICYFYGKLFKKELVVDAHNSGFLLPWIKTPLYKLILKRSSYILIHNEEFLNYLKKQYLAFKFHLLPDPLPKLKFNPEIKIQFTKYILIICSFANDEPLEIIFESIKNFNISYKVNFQFLVTGNYKKNIELYKKYNEKFNINFLGFLNDEIYTNFLLNASAVITISTKKMVQQSAAIESLAACIPMILENSETNRRIFFKGVVLTEISVKSLKNSLIELSVKLPTLKREITELRQEYNVYLQKIFNNFKVILNSL